MNTIYGVIIGGASAAAPNILRRNKKLRSIVKNKHIAPFKLQKARHVELKNLRWGYHIGALTLIGGFVGGGIFFARLAGDTPPISVIVSLFVGLLFLPLVINLLLMFIYQLIPSYREYYYAREMERLLNISGAFQLESDPQKYFQRLQSIAQNYDLKKASWSAIKRHSIATLLSGGITGAILLLGCLLGF